MLGRALSFTPLGFGLQLYLLKIPGQDGPQNDELSSGGSGPWHKRFTAGIIGSKGIDCARTGSDPDCGGGATLVNIMDTFFNTAVNYLGQLDHLLPIKFTSGLILMHYAC